MGEEIKAAAYAAYRMPATAAVLRRILTELASVLSSVLDPVKVLDLGGGTGAGAWAAVEAFGAQCVVTVLDGAPAALEVGRRIAAADPAVAAAVDFRAGALGAGGWHTDQGGEPADLAIVSYVLSELDDDLRAVAVLSAARLATTVLVVEPGTPDGYRRVLDAREQLIGLGWTLLGPCPHVLDCPLAQGDWCHFATRLSRSAVHRRSKDADLSYEDEKYAWVAATSEPEAVEVPLRRAGAAASGDPQGSGRPAGMPVRRVRRTARHLQTAGCSLSRCAGPAVGRPLLAVRVRPFRRAGRRHRRGPGGCSRSR